MPRRWTPEQRAAQAAQNQALETVGSVDRADD
jgi:hypothetical protein